MQSVYQKVAATIMAQLDEAQRDIAAGKPFQMPWTGGGGGGMLDPVNLDGRPYRGGNWAFLAAMQSPSGVWATLRRWNSAGHRIRKGSRGTPVLFFKKLDRAAGAEASDDTSEGGSKRAAMVARCYTVFPAEAVEGFDVDAWRAARGGVRLPQGAEDRDTAAEAALARWCTAQGLGPHWGGSRAFYAPSRDSIHLPPRAAFLSLHGMLSTWAHEAVHATGHEKRLARTFGRFGSEDYAAEELVAELGAAMLLARSGVAPTPRADHARYIASWLRALRDDARFIVSAASRAQAAVDLILGAAAEAEEQDTEAAEGAGEALAA